MRLYEISSFETAEQKKERKGLAIAKYLVKYCQPWLSQTGKGELLVYRGIDDIKRFHQTGQANAVHFFKTVRKDRVPRNTNATTHYLFNKALADCGAVANRSNSVFVTGRKQTAEYYGKDFIIFPIGNFHYVWSPYFNDWYEEEQKVVKAIQDGTFCEMILWDNNSIPEAIHHGGEIMVACDKYIGLDPKFFHFYVKEQL